MMMVICVREEFVDENDEPTNLFDSESADVMFTVKFLPQLRKFQCAMYSFLLSPPGLLLPVRWFLYHPSGSDVFSGSHSFMAATAASSLSYHHVSSAPPKSS